MKGNSQQTFNWRFTLIFALILLGVRLCVALFILFNFDNFLSLSKEYWDLFIILFWGIGYFSTSIVMFSKKALACKNDSNAISELEKVSPFEAWYYPIALFLSSWFLISIITNDQCKYWIIIWIIISCLYLFLLFCLIESINDPKEEKENKEKSDT